MGTSIIGPAVPVILAVIVIGGVAIYFIRQRRRDPPNDPGK